MDLACKAAETANDSARFCLIYRGRCVIVGGVLVIRGAVAVVEPTLAGEVAVDAAVAGILAGASLGEEE